MSSSDYLVCSIRYKTDGHINVHVKLDGFQQFCGAIV